MTTPERIEEILKESAALRRLVIGTHRLWSNKDADKHEAPEAIKDRNGDIALACCRDCGAGEIELEQAICLALTAERDALRKTLEWIRNVANSTYENDPKLRADAARTLKRITERADTALAVGGAS
jgi:hypothetical protein